MSQKLRTLVTFKSSRFNTSEPEPDPGCPCFGHDVAVWLISELQRSGHQTDDAQGEEDFGWYFDFQVGGVKHCFVIAYRSDDPNGEGDWFGWLERRRSLVLTLLGRRRHGITPAAASAIHGILKSDPTIRDVRWHFMHDFKNAFEEQGAAEPL